MKYRLALLFFCLIATAGANAASAATVNLSFRFTNVGNGGGLVTGLIMGLQDNTLSIPSSVQITSNALGFGIGEYMGPTTLAYFELQDGNLMTFDFEFNGKNAPQSTVACCSFKLEQVIAGWTPLAGLSNSPSSVNSPQSNDFSVTHVPGPTPIALPAPVLMLGSALAGLSLLLVLCPGDAKRRPVQILQPAVSADSCSDPAVCSALPTFVGPRRQVTPATRADGFRADVLA